MPNGKAQSPHYNRQFSRSLNLISTCYHEAGHTIIGLLHLIKVHKSEAKIYKDGKIGGEITYNKIPYELDNELQIPIIIGEIKLNYAGILAEKYLLKLSTGTNLSPFFLKWGSKSDISWSSQLIRQYQLASPGLERSRLKQRLNQEVNKELQLHWNSVILVAQFLFKNKQASYEDLRNILCCKSKDKKFWREQFKKIDLLFSDDYTLDYNQIKYIVLF